MIATVIHLVSYAFIAKRGSKTLHPKRAFKTIGAAVLNESDNHTFPSVLLDLDRLYANHLRTCAMSGVESVSRERALGLIQEWTEVLSGRLERLRVSA